MSDDVRRGVLERHASALEYAAAQLSLSYGEAAAYRDAAQAIRRLLLEPARVFVNGVELTKCGPPGMYAGPPGLLDEPACPYCHGEGGRPSCYRCGLVKG